MNITMPDELKDLITALKSDGDFTAISQKINGTNELRQQVRTIIVNGRGDAKIILAIKSFYKEKQAIMQQLTAA